MLTPAYIFLSARESTGLYLLYGSSFRGGSVIVASNTRLPSSVCDATHTALLVPAQNSADGDSDYDLAAVSTSKIDKDGKFSNWASTAQSKPAKVFTPKTAADVQNILAEVWYTYARSICIGVSLFKGRFFCPSLSNSSAYFSLCTYSILYTSIARRCSYWASFR